MIESHKQNKAVLGVMGEFSAGKSTLCNLILGTTELPERITASQLPPIWFTKGTAKDVIVMPNGDEHSLDETSDLVMQLSNASHILLHRQSTILDNLDIVDFPGISDPNMDPAVWQRLLPKMDAVLWLTHASQAWRQSEAAVWRTVTRSVREKSALVVTQMDKLLTESDKARLLRRVQHEAVKDFRDIFPLSLLQAKEDNTAQFEASGIVDLVDYIFALADEPRPEREPRVDVSRNATPSKATSLRQPDEMERSVTDDAPYADTHRGPETGENTPMTSSLASDEVSNSHEQNDSRVMPRRVKPREKSTRLRLSSKTDAPGAAAVAELEL